MAKDSNNDAHTHDHDHDHHGHDHTHDHNHDDVALDFYTSKKLSDSEIELSITLPQEAFEQSYKEMLAQHASKSDIKGFRKGKVPTDLIQPKVRQAILAETFERIAPYYVNAALIKEKIEPVAPPKYTDLEELKAGSAIKFKVVVTVMPEFKLGDMKKIKVEDRDVKVTDKEVQETLEQMHKNNKPVLKDKVKGDKIDDKWAKAVAELYQFDKVKNLADLKKEVRKLGQEQKEVIVKREAVGKAVRDAVKLSGIEVPQAAIDYEAEQREDAFKKDLQKMNLSIRDFLKQRDVTLEEMKKMWQADAKEAYENDVFFKLYAEKNKISVNDEELEAEIGKIKLSDAAAAKDKNELDESLYENPTWKEYIRSYILKQKAYTEFVKEVLGEGYIKEVESPDTPQKDEASSESKKPGNDKSSSK